MYTLPQVGDNGIIAAAPLWRGAFRTRIGPPGNELLTNIR